MMDDRMDRTIQEAAAEYNRPPEPPREEMWAAIAQGGSAGASSRGRAAAAAIGSFDGPAAGDGVLPFRRRVLRVAVPVGVAALLALAFGMGRVSVDEPLPASSPVVADGPSQPGTPLAGAAGDSAATAELETAVPTELATTAPTTEPPSRRTAEPSRRADQPSQLSEPPSTYALTLAAREHLAQAESFLVLFRASLNAGQPVEPIVPATARYLLASNRLLIDSPAAEQPGMRRLLSDVELVLAQIAQLPADSADTTDERLITDGIEQHDLLLRIRSAAGDTRGMPNQGVL